MSHNLLNMIFKKIHKIFKTVGLFSLIHKISIPDDTPYMCMRRIGSEFGLCSVFQYLRHESYDTDTIVKVLKKR